MEVLAPAAAKPAATNRARSPSPSKIPVRSPSTTPRNRSPKHARDTRSSSPVTPSPISPAPGSKIPISSSPRHRKRSASPPSKKQTAAKQRLFQSTSLPDAPRKIQSCDTFAHTDTPGGGGGGDGDRTATPSERDDQLASMSKGESMESIPTSLQDDDASISSTSTLSFSISSMSVPSKVSLTSDGAPHLNPLLLQGIQKANTMQTEEQASYDDNDTHLRLLHTAQSTTLLNIKIKQLESEKESLQSELRSTNAITTTLTEENRLLKEVQSQTSAKMYSLKLRVEELEQKEARAGYSHALEVSQLKQELTDENREERAELMTQLNQMKQDNEKLRNKLSELQTEHKVCQKQLAMSSLSQSEQFVAMTAELSKAKEKIKALQGSFQKCEKEKEIVERSLDLEKSNGKEVQEILTSLRQTLEKSTSQIESLHSELLTKISLLQEKENQVVLLQKELIGFKEDYQTATASCQAMQLQVEVIQKTVLSKTVQLEEEQRQRKITEMENVELNLKLSDVQRDLKEKENLLEEAVQQSVQLSTELKSLRTGSSSLKQSLVDKEAALQAEAVEIAELQKEKELTARSALEMEAQLQLAMDSKNAACKELNEKISELQAQNRSLQQLVEETDQQKKSLQLMQQATSSSAELEKEKNNTMGTEITSLKRSLYAIQEKATKLEKELAEATAQNEKLVESEAQLQAEIEEKERLRQELADRLSTVDTNLRQKEKELNEAQSTCTNIESQVASANTDNEKFKEEITSLKAKLNMEQEAKSHQLQTLQRELDEQESEANQLREQVNEFCQQLNAGDGTGGLPEALARVKLRETEASERMRVEREELLGTIARVKNELASSKVELASSNASLMQAQQECNQLQASINSEVATHAKMANTLSELQLEHSEAVDRLKELETQLREKVEENDRVRLRLEETQEHCSTLQEELRLQNEVSTASAKSMEMKMKEKIRHLQTKIDKVTQKLNQAEGAIKELRRDVVTTRDESNSMETQLSETNNYLREVTTKLEEERTARTEFQKKTRELEVALQQEKDTNEKLGEQLTGEKTKLQLAEAQQSKQGSELSSLNTDNATMKLLLEEEQARTLSLKEQLKSLQAEQAILVDNFERTKETGQISAKHAEEEISALKRKHVCENESLKENIKDLHSDIQSLRCISDTRGEEIDRLEKKESTLQAEKTKLLKKLVEKDRELKEKKEALTTSEIRVQSLEVQLSNMQVEVIALSRSQREMERFKKKLEISSKEEVKQVLEKVTDQLEHQYTAHQELEKLRVKQETMLLREKERQIGQLKNELHHKKLEHKKDKLQIEALELETKYLRSQTQDEERSRRRFEARIMERLDESRNASAPPPLSCSTPRSLKY